MMSHVVTTFIAEHKNLLVTTGWNALLVKALLKQIPLGLNKWYSLLKGQDSNSKLVFGSFDPHWSH
jgi:hypothetical protein